MRDAGGSSARLQTKPERFRKQKGSKNVIVPLRIGTPFSRGVARIRHGAGSAPAGLKGAAAVGRDSHCLDRTFAAVVVESRDARSQRQYRRALVPNKAGMCKKT